MAIVKQVLVAEVLRNRERLGVVQYFEATDAQLVTARRAVIGSGGAGDDDRRLAQCAARRVEISRGDLRLRDGALQDAGAVAHDDKRQLARGASAVDPATHRDFVFGGTSEHARDGGEARVVGELRIGHPAADRARVQNPLPSGKAQQ